MILSLPKATPAPMAQRIVAAISRPKRLLFVEDDDVFKQYLAEIIGRKFDCEIMVVASTAEAKRLLADQRFDAALLDVKVADGDGVSLYRFIVSRWPTTDVVFLTGFKTQDVRERIEQVGPARVFSKERMTDPDFVGTLLGLIGIRPRASC